MKNLIVLFVALAVLSLHHVFPQNFKVQLPPGYNKISMTEEIPGKEGSPYLLNEWLPGTILLNNGTKIEGLTYRYSVYRKEMQYQKENSAYAIGAPDSIKALWMDKRLFVYLTFTNESKTDKDFFEVLVDGKAKLLIRYVTEIIPANYNKALDVGNKNDQITIKETYYVQKDNESPVLIDKKGKTIAQTLADQTEEIKKFTDKEHISFKKKEDLTRLIDYYNSKVKIAK